MEEVIIDEQNYKEYLGHTVNVDIGCKEYGFIHPEVNELVNFKSGVWHFKDDSGDEWEWDSGNNNCSINIIVKIKFYVIGDTHGNHQKIKSKIRFNKIINKTIFHVGDFGVGFKNESADKHELLSLNKFLKTKNIHLYVIRGNHDNPEFFKGEYDYSNLHLVPDYTVINVDGDEVLMVGGAISVDRKPRKDDMLRISKMGIHHETYWYDEGFVLDTSKVEHLDNIKYVITHSSPKFTTPINSQSNEFDSHGSFIEHFVERGDTKLKDDLNSERNKITELWDILNKKNNIKKWWFGHFHQSNREVIYGTEFILLNIDELYAEI